MRSKLIVKGNVQGVGYRALVRNIALMYGIKGSIKNLPSGDVEIYIDCPDTETENKFLNKINKKSKNEENYALPHVIEIKKYDEGSEEYKNPPSYEGFTVENVDMSDMILTQESIILGGNYMIEGLGEVKSAINEVKDSVNDVKTTLSEKIDSMHADMNTRFDRLDDKYKLISETLTNFIIEFKEYNKKLDEHNRKLDEILAILTENKKKKSTSKKAIP
ncbi:MAG: acylphosphatase [Thermoplasmata archaeon]